MLPDLVLYTANGLSTRTLVKGLLKLFDDHVALGRNDIAADSVTNDFVNAFGNPRLAFH